MALKVETVNRWEACLEGDATVPGLSVSSIDGDDKSVKVRLGSTERAVYVADWMALAAAVNGKVKYTATR
jgi:hypothetical protein